MDWETTIDTIKDEKCILFLGPEIFSDEERGRLEGQLLDYLMIDKTPGLLIYNDGLFFFPSGEQKTNTYYKIKRFFNQSFPSVETLLEKIARIPFHFIISVNPDNKLSEAFDRLQISHRHDFYWKKQAADHKAKIPTKSLPLVYNILGSLDSQESLVLTHDDLFEYFESIFQEKSMPRNFKHHIKSAKNFIFLGVPFDKWYFQLMLRILHLHKDEDFMKYALNQSISDDIKTLCRNEFQINFISHNIQEFVENLYRYCEEARMLREAGKEKTSPIVQINRLISRAELEQAFNRFEAFLFELGEDAEELADNLSIITNRYHRLLKRVMMGNIDERDIDVKQNKIVTDLLSLLNEAKKIY